VEHRGHIHFVGPESGFMQVNTRLICPEQSGDLTRSSAAPDGASCTYTGPNEEAVLLQLTPLAGASPQAVLARLEAQLKSEVGLTAPATPPPNSSPPSPPSPPSANGQVWDAGRIATRDPDKDDDKDDDDDDPRSAASTKSASHDDHTNIDLPGLHISTNGDKADVSLPGLSIHANGDSAQVHAGGWWGRSATIEGHDGGATIRAGRADPSGVDSMLIVTSDHPGPSGYRTVGYLAKGPPGGPLVVATFKAKSGDHGGHDLGRDGLKRLLRANVRQGFGWFSDSAADVGKDASS